MSMEDDAMDYDYYVAAEADDEERELEAQNEAEDARRFVLGSSAAAAIDVDGAGAGARTGTRTRTGSTSPTGTATASTSGNRSRRRGPTSKVCLDFEEITEIHAGKEVRVSAICLHCKNTLSAKSSSGTGHLRRHLDLCPSKKEKHRHAKEDYISVVAHFVNSDWCLEKRLLDLKPIEVAHTGANFAERVEMVASDYGITDKIFAIVLDNASSNKTAMDVLKPVFSGYIGSLMPKPARNEDDLAAVFLHQCCACHIINLIVNSCLKRLLPYLEDFRTAITFLNSSNQCIASYKQYCLSVGVRPRKFGVDMDVRWNSTYLMLKHLVPYQSTFSVWIETNHPRKEDGSFLLTPNHWAAAEKLLSFLQLFYDSTVALSGVYYPTSPLMPHHILKIARHLNAYESYELLRPAIVPMKTKFLKYWREIPILCAFAFILDPRAKIREFNKVLQNRYPTSMRTKLTKIFQVYERKFGDACLSNPILPGGASDNGACASAGAGTSSSSDLSELSSYLDSDTERHNQTYPILSILAKNVLTVPVPTVSSKSTFSLASRVLKERRRRLTLDMVETGSWLTHKQHTVEKESKELEAAFEAMYLDDEGTSPDSTRKEQESGNAANIGARKKDKGPANDT
ncbi:hypothetical protein U9M48_039277 [Paspalum notatum var. saurae]|uniref:Transposase n=1 Tax=Paspalum notatum var. saurae TaxID=547442 RepID=A0AAQ3XEG2_PASNO